MIKIRQVLCYSQDTEIWHKTRANYLTASDIPAVMGINPYRTKNEVMTEKLGCGKPFVQSGRMWWGSQDEADNVRKLGLILDCQTEPSGAMVAHPNPMVRAAATLDALIYPARGKHPAVPGASQSKTALQKCIDSMAGRKGPVPLEMKLTSHYNAKNWSKLKMVPEYYIAQLQVQMACMQVEWGVICARVGAFDIRPFVVEADQQFRLDMEEAVARFWEEHAMLQGEWS